MKVSILGTEYDVEIKKYEEDPAFEKDNIDGYCDGLAKQIVVCDMSTYPDFAEETREDCEAAQKVTLRHEIVHAFLNESGLQESSIRYAERGWAKNEEMVDWLAIQGPKIYKAWEHAGAI